MGVLLFSAVLSRCFSVFFIFLSLFLLFLHPCIPQLPAREPEKSLSSVAFSFRCSRVVSSSSPRDGLFLGWGSVQWVGHTTHKWELLPFDLNRTDARDALYEVC
jgi:hypothetical protein